jgi:DNA-binding PadR family transcriptional regulator
MATRRDSGSRSNSTSGPGGSTGSGRTLSLHVIHILLALADGDRHGYAIKQEVERQTDGAIRLGPGTLYEAIQRLEQMALIEEAQAPRHDDDRVPRRYYRLTRKGWTLLKAEIGRLERLVDLAHAKPRLKKLESA